MIPPPSEPANETNRLHELRSTALLDTAPDPSFDAFTELAAHICGTPMSFISLVDERRVWFKSASGLALTEIARDVSFCTHIVAHGQPLQVEDATCDPRFADMPLVIGEPKLRFYAGVPLSTANGIHLGALSVVDQVPRVLSEQQERALAQLASAVVTQIQLYKSAIQREKLHAALNRSNDDLTTFIRAASHDLKGPLRSIIIMSEALRQGSAQTEAERVELLDAIRGAASRGHRLVSDLLQHTNVHLVDHADRVELNGILAEVRSELGDAITEHQASITCESLPAIRGNPAIWHVLLKNLVENAIKYTPSDRPAKVHIEGHITQGSLHLSVHDEGCGIESRYVERIFRPLERLHGSDISGSGIGLATVRRLVSQLNGQVTVTARQPRGSTFTIIAPFSEREGSSQETSRKSYDRGNAPADES